MTREIITRRRPDLSGGPVDPELADAITRACEDRAGRPLAGGRELRFRCPAAGHDDRHPSARWHPDKQVWHCDACGAGGGAIDLARLLGLPLGPGVAPRAGSSWLGDVPTLSPTGGGVVPTPNPGRPGSLNHLKVISAHPSQGGGHSTDQGGGQIVEPRTGRPLGRIVATYPYGAGRRVVRYEPKTFRPQHLAEGCWRTGRGPDPWPLYRQGELPDDRSVAVHVTEGEKDADALAGLGQCAVSPGSSATPWRPEWTGLLAGRPVVVHADHDPPGERRAEEIAGLLAPVAASVRVVPYRELPAGGDVSDFLASHGGEDLWARIAATPEWVVSVETPPPAPPTPRGHPGGEGSPSLPEPLPEFPLAVLPPAVRAYVERAAASLAVPPEMVAAPLLALAGSLAGNRVRLAIKGTFRVLPTLWVAVVAPPGSAKTPAIGFARHGLASRQREAYRQWQAENESYESFLSAWRANKDGERGPEPRRPELRHYWTSNTTTEALAANLLHAHGIAIVADELSGWIAGMDQYRSGKGADRQTFLSAWSGDPTKIDRKSGPPVLIDHPVVSVVGGIQDELVGSLQDRHRRQDGMVDRFLFVRPALGPPRWTEDDVPEATVAGLERVFVALDGLPPMDGMPATVHRHPEARTLWGEWIADHYAGCAGLAGLAAGFASKWPNQVGRLALVLHLLWAASEGTDPLRMLSRERLAAAISLGDWFWAHMRRTLPLLDGTGVAVPPPATGEDGPPGVPGRIVRFLRRQDEAWVPRTQLYSGLRNVSAPQMQAGLSDLKRAKVVERRLVPSTTRPREEWRLRDPDGPGEDSQDSFSARAPAGPTPAADAPTSTTGAGALSPALTAEARALADELRDGGPDAIAAFRRDLDASPAPEGLAPEDLAAARLALRLAEAG